MDSHDKTEKTGLAKLTPAQRAMWMEYLNNGFIQVDAYVKMNAAARKRMDSGEIKDKNFFAVASSKYFIKIKKIIGEENLLEAFGLGKTRVLTEMEQRLNAKTTKFWQDRPICDVEDNTTRMKATDLLSRLNGMDKPKQDTGAGSSVQIYIPHNGREDNNA